MDEEARNAYNKYMREYARKYRKAHPEKVKEYKARYWKRKSACEKHVTAADAE